MSFLCWDLAVDHTSCDLLMSKDEMSVDHTKEFRIDPKGTGNICHGNLYNC